MLKPLTLARTSGLALILAAGVAVAPAFAQMSSGSMSAPHGRFSSAHSYTGQPDLALTLSMVMAGGGPKDFSSTKLVGVLAGAQTKAEVAKLQKQFGGDNVTSFLDVFNFVVNDALKIATDKGVKLPSAPSPSPNDGKALAAALYKAGVTTDGKYDVEVMLDKLVSHPIHVQVMNDIDAKFGAKADGNYHAVLTQAMEDLKAAYGL
jgi:hypothetical protein